MSGKFIKDVIMTLKTGPICVWEVCVQITDTQNRLPRTYVPWKYLIYLMLHSIKFWPLDCWCWTWFRV